ncbi:MAG: AAA family ATPase [Thermodesulfobacteriota bacterium]|nr:AAA family ATPase [Thermodesulfobacteriota bacterium]
MGKFIRQSVPRIEELSVKNYRALKDLQLKGLTPLTVFLGPNGSGKSTIFDVFAFLSECFSVGLRKAWDKRGRFKELRTRGSDGPIVFELKYREKPNSPIITYHLAINEDRKGPYVAEEWLKWRRAQRGQPFRFLDFERGAGRVITGEAPDERAQRIEERLDSPEMIAVNTLGQFAKHPRVSALRRFITGWYLSYLTADNTRVTPEAGPQERLSATGDNLPNVIQFLKEQHEDRLDQILKTLSRRVPRLEKVDAELMADGRLLLQIKDAPFDRPILAKFASDGTLKMLAYLTVLYDPEPPQLIGIEEPENHLHPRLLPELAEECREASAHTQLMVTTHSPFFVNGLRSEELWVLYRDESGYTQAKRAVDMQGIKEFMNQGALLGHLWMEGYFEIGDPLTAEGGPKESVHRNLKSEG